MQLYRLCRKKAIETARNVSIVSKKDTVEIVVDGNKIDGVIKYMVEESAEKPAEVSISFSVIDSLEVQL